jgi:hypothetical protein
VTLIIDQKTWRTTRYDRGSDGKPLLITPKGLLLHSCEGSRTSSLPWLTTDPRSRVSSNLYVCRNGDVFELAPDTYRTWHAGPGSWDGVTDLNTFIGIECEHKQGQDWPAVQRAVLRELCLLKIGIWNIPQQRVIAHRWPPRPATAEPKYDPTDWPDVELRPWIAALYAPSDPWPGRWGTAVPYRHGWRIETTWRNHWQMLGPAVQAWEGPSWKMVRFSNGGFIGFTDATGIVLYLPEKS